MTEYVCAHYALHQLHILPGVFANLPRREKAFIIASIMMEEEWRGTVDRSAGWHMA